MKISIVTENKQVSKGWKEFPIETLLKTLNNNPNLTFLVSGDKNGKRLMSFDKIYGTTYIYQVDSFAEDKFVPIKATLTLESEPLESE